jgi:FKBP12-rapamycin complex-associated protein
MGNWSSKRFTWVWVGGAGRMRCLAALARWEELSILCRESWVPTEHSRCLEMAPMAANAAWNMGNWEEMTMYVECLDTHEDALVQMPVLDTSGSGNGASDGAFFRAVLCVWKGKQSSELKDQEELYTQAKDYIERGRKCLATELAALVLESYDRAYSNMVRVQQFSELEEVSKRSWMPHLPPLLSISSKFLNVKSFTLAFKSTVLLGAT